MAAENGAIALWIYETLSEDAAVAALVGSRIYRDAAPQAGTQAQTIYPCIIYGSMGGSDVSSLEATRATGRRVWMVKAVCAGASYTPAEAIMSAADAALQGVRGVDLAGGVWQMSVTREGEIGYPETADGVQYRHSGGRYAITYGAG